MENTPIFEKLTIEYMVNGLGDSSLSYDVLTKKPTTVSEAMELITWHECCRASARRRPNVRQVAAAVPSAALQDTTQEIVTSPDLQKFGQELKDSIMGSLRKELETMGMSKKGSKSLKLRCFICNDPNHLARDCPEHPRNKQQTGSQGHPRGTSRRPDLN